MAQVVPLKPSRHLALKFIRERAADTRNIVFLRHAQEAMRKRKINARQVLECLLKGTVTEGPAKDLQGDWRVRMERVVAGDRVVVAVAIDFVAKTLVITVF